ncbi:TetR/AcrR family transcriptional regulator, partial [Clostridioides difficile]|nr:TetR/AcrR family transcriptional regulator [Clostridioides difficile]
VEHAQVAKATFYHYFESKSDMLVALAQRYTSSFLERLQHAVDACGTDDWLARLRAWIRADIETYAATYRTH